MVQKSILRDSVTDLSLDFCAKMKIMVRLFPRRFLRCTCTTLLLAKKLIIVIQRTAELTYVSGYILLFSNYQVIRDVEREDVEFISRMVGCEPVASLENFSKDKLGACDLVYDDTLGESSSGGVTRFCGLTSADKKCVSILVRGSNILLLEETERSIHDALCVVRSLVKRKALIPGGAAPEMEMSVKLKQWARTLGGVEAICIEYFAEALESVPYTLAENAGLKPIEIVTALRKAHAVDGKRYAGINVKKACITDMLELDVVQPLLVSVSIIKMATETVRLILKIDDIVMTRR